MDQAAPQPSEQKPDASLESISKEDLILMVAEKNKDIKNISNKNSKLQSKYINVYKENKAYKKDYETLLSFMKLIFNPLPEYALGSIELSDLELMWAKREAQFNDKLRKLMQEVTNQKLQTEAKQKKEAELRLSSLDQQNKAVGDKLQKQLNDALANGHKLAGQILVLQSKNTNKDEQIERLLSDKLRLEHELNSIKVNSVKYELESSLNAFLQTPKENIDRTEMIQLKQHLQEAIEKNDKLHDAYEKLQEKVRSKNKQIQMLRTALQTERQIRESNHQRPILKKPQSMPVMDKGNGSGKIKTVTIQGEDKEYIQKQYLKNVFVRFMKCLNQSNYVQAEILENVLMTILDFNIRERELASLKPKQWWNIFQ